MEINIFSLNVVVFGVFSVVAFNRSWFLFENICINMLFKYQPLQMVRHIQTIYWQNLANYLSVFDHFVGLASKG